MKYKTANGSRIPAIKYRRDKDFDGKQDFVLGIQAYLDKTGTDAYQRYDVEPLVFTLTILGNHCRNQAKFWRVLARLLSTSTTSELPKFKFGATLRNYHKNLHATLSEFIHYQAKPPVEWVRIGNEYQNRRIRLVWITLLQMAKHGSICLDE